MNDEFYKTLGNLHSLRAALKDATVESLRDLVQKINTIIEQKEREQAEVLQREVEKMKKIKTALGQLEKLGLSPEDLLPEDAKKDIFTPRKQRRNTKEKYEYFDEQGTRKTWTGQGRIPSPIKLQIEKENRTLQDFLIKNPIKT
jgi:DNA-binding protein H-NS